MISDTHMVEDIDLGTPNAGPVTDDVGPVTDPPIPVGLETVFGLVTIESPRIDDFQLIALRSPLLQGY